MTHKLMLAALLALLSSAPALAQDTSTAFDSRWNPYLGCWTVLRAQSGHSAAVQEGTMVCVRPSGQFGVAVTTTVDGKTVLEQNIIADGSAQPLSQRDCSGTQTSNWSRDGERLFTNVELTCAGGPKRVISGITLLANGQWVDSQATVVDGVADVRVRRYRRSSDRSTGPAGMTTAPLSIEDIIEASAKVQSEALEAVLDEANARFELNSRVLIQLADNGVSPNVIDLMVAQAYPEKFQVERRSSLAASTSYGTASAGGSTAYMTGSSMYPYPMYDPFYSSYYYYSPFAYQVLLGPELHLSLRIAVLSELLLLQLLRSSRRRLLLRRRHRLGRQHRTAGIPGLARGQRSRRQRPRLHAGATGRIGQHHHWRNRHAHEPLAELHARRAQPRAASTLGPARALAPARLLRRDRQGRRGPPARRAGATPAAAVAVEIQAAARTAQPR